MGFKDDYRATRDMIEAQRATRKPFRGEIEVKKVISIIFYPLAVFIGGVICFIEWVKKKLIK